MTFVAIDQMDVKILLDQQEDKDIGSNLVFQWLNDTPQGVGNLDIQ